MKPSYKVALIDARLNCGQGKAGTELGPKHLKTPYLYDNLKNLNCVIIDDAEVDDCIDHAEEIEYFNNKNIHTVGKTNLMLSHCVRNAIEQNCVPIVLGGDHSLAIGSVNGSSAALSKHISDPKLLGSDMGLIWIDAHADINTPLTSASGNLHGQPVSFILHELDKYIPRLKGFEWNEACLPARNLCYIGLRDLDPEETILIEKYNIRAYSMSDVQRLGIHQVVKECLDYLTINGELLPLHCSVDIDSLDPWFAPSTGTPVLGGLTLPELMFIGNSIHETGKLKALDLVEVNPMLGANEEDLKKTIFSAQRVILSFFGFQTFGTVEHNLSIKQPNPN